MEGLTIARAAEQTGFTPSALRFYEGQGLVSPARSAAGYRTYDAASIETLRFIARAKRLGLSLEEISDLVALFDDRRCEPVQERLRQLLADKLAEAHDQIATLMAFTAQLQQASARLGTHTPDGPCDNDCGCTTDVPAGTAVTAPVSLTAKPAGPGEPPIACTLGAGEVHQRLIDWQVALREANRREPIAGGVRVHLPRHTPVAPLAALIEAEQTCCRFFTFTVTVGIDAISLDVTGPEGAEDIIRALVGAPVTA
jgi:DNA-binding transcriptional MerR regulator